MRKLYSLLTISLIFIFVSTSCSDKNEKIVEIDNTEHPVNDWIYENMVKSYYWTDDIPKNPDFSLTPDIFFESILSTKDRSRLGYRFSSLEETSDNELNTISATNSNDIGFEYIRVTNEGSNIEYFLVLYPKKGSDAYEKGVDRGRFVMKVDGKDITTNNYGTILSGAGAKTLTMGDFVYNSNNNKYTLTVAEDVTIQMENDFAEAPVYMDSVYTIGGKTIGYMVYNFFATGETDDSHEYDELLMQTLAKIKAKGATEMVLDLRYNGGGTVSTAIALASALVNNRSTSKILATSEYNKLTASEFNKKYGADYNKDFFIDVINNNRNKIAVPSLNLLTLYVLVTESTASASEFVINGLRPYMKVILIGETTYGKNVGSWKIVDDEDPENDWAMQPITVKFSNSAGFSDFTAGFEPNFEVDEFRALNLRLLPFVNTEDPLLSVAINQITGNGPQTRSLGMPKAKIRPEMIQVKGGNSLFKDKSRFEMYDDVRGEKIKKLMQK